MLLLCSPALSSLLSMLCGLCSDDLVLSALCICFPLSARGCGGGGQERGRGQVESGELGEGCEREVK
jgi:hypothetical protein